MKSLFNLIPDNILILKGLRYELLGEPVMGGSSLVYKVRPLDGVFRDYYMVKELYPHELIQARESDGAITFINEKSKLVQTRKERVWHESKIVDDLRYKDKNNNPYFLSYSEPIESNNTLYTIIATESGEMLSTLIDSDYFANKRFEDICSIILKILDALEPIHEKGYVHLDISPDNIHFSDTGVARLVDYNSAYCLTNKSENVMFSVKRGYSAPELFELSEADNINIGIPTDLFSVTAIFFELLVGRRLSDGDWRQTKHWRLNSDKGFLQGVSSLLINKANRFLHKGISITARRRFQSISEMRNYLNELRELCAELKLENNRKCPYSHFVGREKELGQIDAILQKDTYVFLEGIGGIGKSELAKQYAWLYRDSYAIIQFITFNKSLMSTIALSLRIRDFDEAKYKQGYSSEDAIKQIFEDKMACLQRYDKRTLIVVDNYDVEADDHFHRFVSGDYRIIFTSRERHAENALEVTPLELEDNLINLFYKYFGRDNKLCETDKAILLKIFSMVQWHTMTVMLIATAMKIHKISALEMLERLQNSFDPKLESKIAADKEEISAKDRKQLMYSHILNLFNMETFSDDSIIQEDCINVMTSMAVVPYTGIKRNIFIDFTHCDSDTLNRLIQLRWMQIDTDTELVSLHSVISDAANSQLLPDSNKCAGLIEYFVRLRHEFFKLPDESSKRNYIEANRILKVMELACRRILDETGNTACLYSNYANMLTYLGDYENALDYSKKAVAFSEAELGSHHPYTAELYYELALAHRPLQKYEEILPWLYKMLEASEYSDADDWSIADIFRSIGIAYEWCRDHKQAITWYSKALSRYEKVSDKDQLWIADTYALIGDTCYSLEDYRESISWHRKALSIREDLLGISHKRTIESYTRLAMNYINLKSDSEIINSLSRAYEVWESELNIESDGMADVCQVVGAIYLMQGDYNNALKWHTKSAEIRERILGPHHPETMHLHPHIIDLCYKIGDTAQAQKWASKAMENKVVN